MDLGTKILLRAQELKKSRRRIALESGLSPTFVAEVCRGEKQLGIESAKKLAPALEWPVNELLGTQQDSIEHWFWSACIGRLPDKELAELRSSTTPAIVRVSWSLQQVAARFPELDVASLTGTSPEHIARLSRGEGGVSGELLARLTDGLRMPPHWLTLGEPAPSDELMQKVLQHHNASAWLELVSEAMDRDIPPAKIRKMMDTYMDLVENK